MTSIADLILIIPDKPDAERDSLASVWASHGGNVLPLGRFWQPPPVDAARVRLYGPDAFCLVVAQKLGVDLVSPSDDAILLIPGELRGRDIVPCRLDQVRGSTFPVFAKPLVPKAFRAAVYSDVETLLHECRGLSGETVVLTSPVLQIDGEARSFVLDSRVLDCVMYDGVGDLDRAREFAMQAAAHCPCSPVVMDIAHSTRAGWFVLEFNSVWGAGLNGCSPELVYPAIAEACRMRVDQ
jgi:hypothetical protein